MEPGGSMQHLQGSQVVPMLSRIKPVPRTDTYFLKIYSNIVHPSTPSPSYRSLIPLGPIYSDVSLSICLGSVKVSILARRTFKVSKYLKTLLPPSFNW